MRSHPYIHARGNWTREELHAVTRAIETFEASESAPNSTGQRAGKPWICVRKALTPPVFMAQRLGLPNVLSAFSPKELAAKIEAAVQSPENPATGVA